MMNEKKLQAKKHIERWWKNIAVMSHGLFFAGASNPHIKYREMGMLLV
ncbi:hypothetical protein M1V99_00405 (plasmid) [Enterobacter bugandensis]|nr:hypothetical protein [Enterobacter bugandensis]UQQ28761.1 hypothetical protein M1V99_00405 [Enterobacter bugandensis]